MLRVGFDGLSITASPAGVGVAARGLLHALARVGEDCRVTAHVPRGSTALDVSGPAAERIEFVEAAFDVPDTPRALFYQHVRMPRLLRRAGVDVHVGGSFVLPWRPPGVPEAVVVYDAAWVRFPETKTARFRAYMNRVVPASMRRAVKVVACSEFTRDECAALAPELPRERTVVVPLGVRTLPAAETDAAARLGIRAPYVLAVSNHDPRKNLDRLVAAWRLLRERDGLPHALVLPGNAERAAALRARVGARDDEPLHTPGFVSDTALAGLYAGAAAVAVPSLYEGFGFPVIEAMAHGAPVACARAGSLPEVAGEFAALFDPLDVEDMAGTLAGLLRDGRGRVEGARRHAAHYDWDTSGRALLAVLEEISASG